MYWILVLELVNMASVRSAMKNSLPRIDIKDKTTGKAIFTEDLPLPTGTAYCAILGSPYSHARILSIDTGNAERLPGVLAILTRKHLKGMDPYLHRQSSIPVNMTFIAVDKVRYDGEPVAAVAAESFSIAREALGLIEVEYEVMPAVFDPELAVKPEAPQLHDQFGSNKFGEYQWNWGDTQKGFAESDCIFEDRFVFPSLFHYPMENVGGCIAHFRSDRVELVAPIQHPFAERAEIAELFGLDAEMVRIHMPYIGGGFGAKELKQSHLIALWLSREIGRPVTTLPSAEESIRTDARHQIVYKLKTGLKNDGTLCAQEIEMLVDGGAYARVITQIVSRLAVGGGWGPYKIPNMRLIAHSILTNRVLPGAMRGLSKAQVSWAYETNYDHIARRMGLDPFEFRVKNFMRRGDVVAEGASLLDSDYDDMLRMAAEAIGWDGRTSQVSSEIKTATSSTELLRGRGLSTTFRHGYSEGANNYVNAIMNLQGRVKLLQSATEIGMGVYSVLAQLAAETLGIPIHKIDVSHADTDNPHSDGVASSRDTICMGTATQRACEDLKNELILAASMSKGGDPQEWRFEGGRVWHGEQDYAPEEIVADTSPRTGVVIGKGSWITPRRNNPFLGVVPHWETSTAAAEVEVDPETGEVRLLKLATVGDVGRAIQPVVCKGQLDGGAIMGLGNTFYEETVYRDGQFLNGDPLQYRLPVLEDIPEGLYSVLVENDDGPGPRGSKGMGQSGVATTAPAIGNAIYDATGVRIKDLPITPEKILRALGKL